MVPNCQEPGLAARQVHPIPGHGKRDNGFELVFLQAVAVPLWYGHPEP